MWVLLALTAPAAAQRTVAVIDATTGDDAEVATLVGALGEQLEREAPDALVPVAPERRSALVGAMPEEDRAAIADVDAAMPRVRDALARFDDKAAIAACDAGLARAAGIAPTATLVASIADLLFERGYARLSKSASDAERDFALVARLDPARVLSPVKYAPEVLKAYQRATATTATATLDVAAPNGATVWIDGAAVGPAPASVTLAVGLHVVTVTGLRLLSTGQIVEVPASGTAVTLNAAEAPVTVITHRLRRMLIAETDEFARTDRVKELVTLTGAQAAIVVGRDAGEVVIWRYTPLADALGPAISTEGEAVEDLVMPLRPIRIKPPLECEPDEHVERGVCVENPIIVPPPPPTPWYRRRWVQATIGGTLLAGVITTIVAVVTRDPGSSEITGFGARTE